MPVLTITESGESFYPAWAWAPRRGNPAQYYGEPYQDEEWIRQQAHCLFVHRQARQFAQADALRQWLLDYGMMVEYRQHAVMVKW